MPACIGKVLAKKKIDPKVVKHFVDFLERPPQYSPPSDYDRSIIKSLNEKVRRSRSSSASGKKVPHLGEQANQSIPPLNVFSDDDPNVGTIARNLGLTVAQLLGKEEAPKADLAYRYEHGKPLIRPEQVPHLQTQMRRLHEWYMQASEAGNTMLMVAVRDEHYFRGRDEIHVEFDELFQLYNQDDLDKYLVSSYCL